MLSIPSPLKVIISCGIILSSLAGCQVAGSFSPVTRESSSVAPPLSGPTLQFTPTLVPAAARVNPKLAWFYKPPSEDQFPTLLQWYQFFILTRGDEEKRDALIALGLGDRPMLQYIRFDTIHDPGDCTSQPRRNQAAYYPGDFCEISKNHPDWFLLDASGRRISHESSDQVYYQMDPGSPGWRAFFLERVKENQADPAWSGVFLDNVDLTLYRLEKRGGKLQNYPSDASLQAAVSGFLTYLNDNFFSASPKVLFANMVGRRAETDWLLYFPLVDGGMHEGWSIASADRYESPEVWEQHMFVAEQAQEMGKTVVLVTQGNQGNTNQQQFTYASYLLINKGSAYFRYAGSGHYGEIWLYPNYELELGQPLGPRYRDGVVWRRDFEHGSVMVNPATHESDISVK